MKKTFFFLFVFTVVMGAAFGQGTKQQPGNDRYLVVVSMDGFRWDYNLMYETPFLDSLAQAGVDARMRPSYPSKTFPNHYTIATGLVIPRRSSTVPSTEANPSGSRPRRTASMPASSIGRVRRLNCRAFVPTYITSMMIT